MIRSVSLLCLLLSFLFSYAEEVTVIPMKSKLLCNYIENKSDRPLCQHKKLKTVVKCDERRYQKKKCLSIEFTTESFSSDIILSKFPEIDRNSSFRRIVVNLNHKFSHNITHYGLEIDRFLLHRAWWYVVKEPYTWNKPNINSPLQIILHRIHPKIENFFQFMTKIQYPDLSTCHVSPLILYVDTFIHPGWGSIMQKLSRNHLHRPTAIIGFWTSHSNRVTDNVGFIRGEECLHEINKWNCAFLPVTNCSYPSIVTRCRGKDCVFRFSYSLFLGSNETVLPIAEKSRKGMFLLGDIGNIPHNEDQKVLMPLSAEFELLNRFPAKEKRRKHLKWNTRGMMNSYEVFTNDFILRLNAKMRSKVENQISIFREKNKFLESSRCVAVHIRRGDRISYGQNMTEWCKTATNDTSRKDKGCDHAIFGNVKMENVINQAEKLVDNNVRTLFVSNDDELWVKEQRERMKNMYPEWNLIYIEAPKPPKEYFQTKDILADHYPGYQYMRSKGGSESGAFYLASLKIAQQCEAFVGHMGSKTALMIFQKMCSRHTEFEGVCPPLHNLLYSTPTINNTLIVK